MNERTRTTLLLSLLAIVGAVVVFDQTRTKGADTGEAPSSNFAQRAQELQDRLALIEHEDVWEAARDERAAQWANVADQSVRAATPELAVSDFRTLLMDVARTFDLTIDRTDRTTSEPLENVPAGVERVHLLEVRLTLSTHDVGALHRYIDAVEHLPGARTHVGELRMTGPGLAQIKERVSLTLSVRALGVTPAADNTTGGAA